MRFPTRHRGAVGRWRRLARAVALVLGAAALIAAIQTGQRLTPPVAVTVLDWREAWPGFGGWSGLDLSPDGTEAWLVNDGSLLARARLHRDADGRLTAMTGTHLGYVIRPLIDGTNRVQDRGNRDAESLSLLPGGAPLIAFEQVPRLLEITPGGRSHPRAPLRFGPAEEGNRGVEAMAVAANGTVYALRERPPLLFQPHRLFRQPPGEPWQPAARIARRGRFMAVGADFGPDGRFYLLERGITLFGFMSRVRSFDLSPRPAPDTAPSTYPAPNPGRLRGTVVYTSPPGRHGNLEGLGVWRDGAGKIRLMMVEDDNFLPFQRGRVVEVTLP